MYLQVYALVPVDVLLMSSSPIYSSFGVNIVNWPCYVSPCSLPTCSWMQGEEAPQKSEVHYRCVGGEGNFNWRFVFPFEYLPQEKLLVVKKKEHFFSLDTTERRVPPRLTVQLWDSELIGSDEYMGKIAIRVRHLTFQPAHGLL